MFFQRLAFISTLALAVLGLGACQAGPAQLAASQGDPRLADRTYATDVLFFAGSGTWSPEVASITDILDSHAATYAKVSSAQLNAMSLDQIASYGTLLFPGGSGGTESNSLTAATRARLREAVQQRGVSWVGFCAGAFIAAAPAPAPGQDVSYGVGVLDWPELQYYYLENQGTDIAMTLLTMADGSTKDVLWYGGPMTPDRGVIARYPDGTPAMSQVWSGHGLVVLSGPHPTATAAMESSLGVTSSDGVHRDLAWDLIDAAIRQREMPAFN